MKRNGDGRRRDGLLRNKRNGGDEIAPGTCSSGRGELRVRFSTRNLARLLPRRSWPGRLTLQIHFEFYTVIMLMLLLPKMVHKKLKKGMRQAASAANEHTFAARYTHVESALIVQRINTVRE
jgi:hypothetical protein